MDVNQSAVDELMTKYPNTDLIHGHTHRQNTHKMERYTRYVLGDWKNNQGNAIKLGESLEWLEINYLFSRFIDTALNSISSSS